MRRKYLVENAGKTNENKFQKFHSSRGAGVGVRIIIIYAFQMVECKLTEHHSLIRCGAADLGGRRACGGRLHTLVLSGSPSTPRTECECECATAHTPIEFWNSLIAQRFTCLIWCN